jgi:hypothetical protein
MTVETLILGHCEIREEEVQRQGRAILVFCQGDESLSCRYRFVSAHSSSGLPDDQRHAVTRLCEAVNVKRGSYCTGRRAALALLRSRGNVDTTMGSAQQHVKPSPRLGGDRNRVDFQNLPHRGACSRAMRLSQRGSSVGRPGD